MTIELQLASGLSKNVADTTQYDFGFSHLSVRPESGEYPVNRYSQTWEVVALFTDEEDALNKIQEEMNRIQDLDTGCLKVKWGEFNESTPINLVHSFLQTRLDDITKKRTPGTDASSTMKIDKKLILAGLALLKDRVNSTTAQSVNSEEQKIPALYGITGDMIDKLVEKIEEEGVSVGSDSDMVLLQILTAG